MPALPTLCRVTRCDVVVGCRHGRAPHDKQLADVLHWRSLEFGTDACEQPLALFPVRVEDTYLDQFMREQIHVELVQHRGGQALATNAHDRIEALRSGPQFATLRGCQSLHGESLAHCRQRLGKSAMSRRASSSSAMSRNGACLDHTHHRQRHAVWQCQVVTLDRTERKGSVKRFAGKRRDQLEPLKARIAGGAFARDHDKAADALPRMCRMHEKGANACRVATWIEQRIVARAAAIAAEKRLAPTPAAATDNGPIAFGDKVGAVGDEAVVDRENRAECGLDLGRRIGRRL